MIVNLVENQERQNLKVLEEKKEKKQVFNCYYFSFKKK